VLLIHVRRVARLTSNWVAKRCTRFTKIGLQTTVVTHIHGLQATESAPGLQMLLLFRAGLFDHLFGQCNMEAPPQCPLAVLVHFFSVFQPIAAKPPQSHNGYQ
jgi:hypothetical protein